MANLTPLDTERRFITEGEGLPQWDNPISHAVVAGNMCFVSGQLSVGQDGQYIADSIEGETQRAFTNVFNALNAAGFSPSEIVYIDLAFIDLDDLAQVNTIYMTLFEAGKRPARTVYQAAALPFGAKIKIVATAVSSKI